MNPTTLRRTCLSSDEEEKYCTSDFVKNRLSLSDMTLWRLLRSGKFPRPALVLNRRRLWRLSDIRAFEASHRPPDP